MKTNVIVDSFQTKIGNLLNKLKLNKILPKCLLGIYHYKSNTNFSWYIMEKLFNPFEIEGKYEQNS